MNTLLVILALHHLGLLLLVPYLLIDLRLQLIIRMIKTLKLLLNLRIVLVYLIWKVLILGCHLLQKCGLSCNLFFQHVLLDDFVFMHGNLFSVNLIIYHPHPFINLWIKIHAVWLILMHHKLMIVFKSLLL